MVKYSYIKTSLAGECVGVRLHHPAVLILSSAVAKPLFQKMNLSGNSSHKSSVNQC